MPELAAAVFEGHLQAPGLGKCGLSYRFGNAMDPPMPAAVKTQRRQLGWSTKEQEISCFGAICSIPDLGLESEDVIISVDAAGLDGSRQMLLQSLARPDLGLTVLLLDSNGQITGGDESWTPGTTPIIRAKRCIDPPAPPPRPPPGPASPRRRVTSKSVRVPEPDAEPPADEETATAAPAAPVPKEELLGFGVVGGSDLPDTEEVSACMPLPTGDEATGRVLPGDQPPRATHAGGIGRSAGTKMSKSKVQAGYKKSESMRPDEATGKPGAKLEGSIMSTGTSTGTTVNSATAAADQERLVSAAVAGEVDDVQQLLGRAGVRIDGLVEEGRHAKLTALMAASARGRTEVVRVLLSRKAGIDVRDAQGWTALMHAIHGQRIDVCQLLLDNKAEFQHVEGGSPLILAASGARYEFCKMLVEKKVALSVPDSEGCTALHHAARRGRGAAVATLLAARAKLEKQDAQGHTPLIAAAAAGRADTVQLLLTHGADAKALDASGRGARELAIAYQHDRVVKVLQNPYAQKGA